MQDFSNKKQQINHGPSALILQMFQPMTDQLDISPVLQLVKMLGDGQIFHQRWLGKPEKNPQIIDLKKLFQPIVYWLLLLMSDF